MTKRFALFSTGRADEAGLTSVATSLEGHAQIEWMKDSEDPLPRSFSRGHAISIVEFTSLARCNATKRTAALLEQLGNWLESNSPDLLLLLGDRYELLAALGAAIPLGIPIGHISGGEVTYGAFDEQIRHAVTKAAHLHFTGHDAFARRVLQMGEEAWRIHVTGDPGLDGLEEKARRPLPYDLLHSIDHESIVVAMHPVTINRAETWKIWDQIAKVLENEDGFILVTGPNRDPDSERLQRLQQAWCSSRSNRRFIETLGDGAFAPVVANAGCLVGNSSAAIWETPTYGTPSIVIGTRQSGRLRGKNVIDVAAGDESGLDCAIRRARSASFRQLCAHSDNPYGDGRAGARIADILLAMPDQTTLRAKRFADRESK